MIHKLNLYCQQILKILSKRIIPVWVVLVSLVVGIIAIRFGLRITYSPELENSWSAIGAIGGWASAIVSGIAIWFAVSAPKKIALDQNKIALFEKRYNIYITFSQYILFSQNCLKITTQDHLREYIHTVFKVACWTDFVARLRVDENTMSSSLFLFKGICSCEKISKMMSGMMELADIAYKEDSNNINARIEHALRTWGEFENQSMSKIVKLLEIK